VLAVSVAAGTLAAGLTGLSTATAAPPVADLGPTVIRTNEGPSGQAVTFRYRAPEGVEAVHVYGDWFFSRPENVTCDGCGDSRHPSQWQPGDIHATPWRIIPMELGADGVWETTVPVPSGTYRYAFTHDCTSEIATGCTLNPDPANPWPLPVPYPGAPGAVRSTVFVPENKKFPTYDTDYQAPTTRTGSIEARRYPSPLSTNPAGVHDVVVYTPHGYDPDRATPYPTLYLSHGGGDHSTAWINQGVAHRILENTIQEKAAQPMVIVMTDFNGIPGGNNGYVNELRTNVFPFIEGEYNVSTRAEDRAFAGFSAGGSRAYTLMYDHTELFGYHGAWSAGGPLATPAQVERMKAVAGTIMIGTGRQDKLGNIGVNSQLNAERLRQAGVEIDEYNVEGVHTWHVWRPLLDYYLREVAFRATGTAVEAEVKQVGRSEVSRVVATATVDPVTTSATAPSGWVDFHSGEQYLGTAKVRDGVATLRATVRTDQLAGPVVATYEGDRYFDGSQGTATTG
jgi:enterochelin esterase-like enzyme